MPHPHVIPGVPVGAIMPGVSNEGPQPQPMTPPAVLAAQQMAVASAHPKRPRVRIHLRGPGYSSRAVVYQQLTAGEIDHLEAQSVQGLGASSGDQLSKAQQVAATNAANDMGVRQMIVAISEPVEPKDLASVKMMPVTPEYLDNGYESIFTTKDIFLLRSLYVREHQVMKTEVEDILAGKAPYAG